MRNKCTGVFSARCGVCVAGLVERVCTETGIRLTDAERCQLIGGLLARQHLILSGSPGSRHCGLAPALAMLLADRREDHVCFVSGHPWWASGTGDVAYYANMQMAFSEWRLVYFLADVLADGQETPGNRSVDRTGSYVVCIERMSPAEIELYFGLLPYRLVAARQGMPGDIPVRFIGTYDSDTAPTLDARTLHVAALVHMNAIGAR
jgi:hypothetical protein